MLNFKERISTSIIFIAVIILLFLDIYEDFSEGAPLSHVTKEAAIMLLGLVGIFMLWKSYFSIKLQNESQKHDIVKLKNDLQSYKLRTQDLSEGLSGMINQQLIDWNLTESEKDIALLLLKGLSLREIAEIRNSSEKTIKQHASNLYAKANLNGRAELSAFFLEDLLILK
ncbi:LuxR C-terminal-related transcriptional regulator [Bacteriovorax sp. Seq25_V]|uniref:helix-turn-helix transcriptional regulator n=1 Tax=Bacteriovorax sp. Seq25_V TaxID=1201288 RepID=UPI00038A367B|nr:LuxR C-terminal-related transcriptional regulator [Bacteriovorax sp. Seq25_V]EQC46578.1 transcriptional regulator, LuxR family [Bacteriovorax sp. Seq25_V]